METSIIDSEHGRVLIILGNFAFGKIKLKKFPIQSLLGLSLLMNMPLLSLPYDGLDPKKYLKAFNTFDVNHTTYGSWVEKRREKLLAKIDSFDSLTTIIAAGNISMKMAFLCGLYPEAQFALHTLSSGKPCFIAEVTSKNRKIKLIATQFFDNQNGIKLQGLKEVAELIY